MSFTTFSGVNSLFFAAAPPPPSFAATFGALTALGQVPITGISGKFTTYSVLNNGSTVATGQTASTYTMTGLGDNVQIGPVTLVPYDNLGVAGSPTTVKGGSGGGNIYTWAQANAPTFTGTVVDSTTLTCTGAFSKVYVTFSGGSASPASGTLITGTNSISQQYSGMTASTTYTFVVYPVNGDGIPVSVTGTNSATGSIKTSQNPLWVATGIGSVNTLAYSTDGTMWTGLGKLTFNSIGFGVSYGGAKQSRWVATGRSSAFAYSTDGTKWT